MSDKIEDGGPAFPQIASQEVGERGEYTTEVYSYGGMSLRDYFAVHATEDDLKAQAEVIRHQLVQSGQLAILPDDWRVRARYMHADAMLAARGKR